MRPRTINGDGQNWESVFNVVLWAITVEKANDDYNIIVNRLSGLYKLLSRIAKIMASVTSADKTKKLIHLLQSFTYCYNMNSRLHAMAVLKHLLCNLILRHLNIRSLNFSTGSDLQRTFTTPIHCMGYNR